MSGVKRLSYSTMNELLDVCAKRTYYDKVVRLDEPPNVPMVAGIATHEAIEAHEKARWLWFYSGGKQGDDRGISLSDMLTVARLSIEEAVAEYDELGPDFYHEAYEASRNSLRHWYEGEIPKGQYGAGDSLRERVLPWKPLAVEHYIGTWIPTRTVLRFVGVPDAVYDTGAEIVPVDWKTPANWNSYKKSGEYQRAQATTYQWMLDRSSLVRDAGTRVEFHCARRTHSDHGRFQDSRVIVVEPDKVDLQQLLNDIERADKIVEDGVYPANPDSFLCSAKWCSFHPENDGPCDLTTPGRAS